MEVLKITNLKKCFGDKEVLSGLNLSVNEHSILGLVGKNGAGKTTTMKMILGLLKIDDGEIMVLNNQVHYAKTIKNIGYLPDVPEFYPFMTAREYLKLCGECLNMDKETITKRSEELLLLVNLSNEKHQIKGFSRGMKQRLGIAQALLSKPKLLICDEPTSALDPIGRKEILDILLALKEQTTIIFSTHILADVERICSDVAFLDNGKIIMQAPISKLKNMYHRDFIVETSNDVEVKLLCNSFQDCHYLKTNQVIFNGETKMHDVLTYIVEHKIAINKVEYLEPSLENLFMEVIKK